MTHEVSRLSGVTGVDVNLSSGTLTITSETTIDDSDIRAAVEEAGYQLAEASSS